MSSDQDYPSMGWPLVKLIGTIALVVLIAVAALTYLLPIPASAKLYAYLPNHSPLVSLASGTPGDAYSTLGETIAESLRSNGEYRDTYTVYLQVSGGSMENLAMVESGRAEFALVHGAISPAPESPPAAKPSYEVRGLATLQTELAHLILAETSEIQSFRDLSGKRVYLGTASSGSRALAQSLASFYGMELSSVDIDITAGEASAIMQAFDGGEIDAAFLMCALYSPVVDELLRTGKYGLAPFNDAEAIAAFLPGTFSAWIPTGAYGPGRTMPQESRGRQTIASNTLLVAGGHVPDAKVWALLDSIYSRRFESGAGVLAPFTEEQGRLITEYPLHPAAEAYYERDAPIAGATIRNILCIAALTAILLFLLRSYAIYRRQRIVTAHRNAITPYFEEMSGFGLSIQRLQDRDRVMDMLNEMMRAHAEAEAAWLSGRLDTNDFETLYAAYSVQTQHALHKAMTLQLDELQAQSADSLGTLQRLTDKLRIKSATPAPGTSRVGPKSPPRTAARTPAPVSSRTATPKAAAPKPEGDEEALPHMLIPPDTDNG